MSFARSWDLPGARPPARRAGLVIGLAQVPLRPLVRAFVRLRIENAHRLNIAGPMVIAGNHTGPFDALAYGYLLQSSGVPPRFLAKHSLFEVPVLGPLLRRTRQIPVHRGAGRGGDALAAAERELSADGSVMVFPEGTYTRDPAGWPMRARLGTVRLALRTGAPIVPVACVGSREFWPVGAVFPRLVPRRTIILHVGEPYVPQPRPGETQHDAEIRLTAELMDTITELIAALRGDQPPPTPYDPTMDAFRPEDGMRRPREESRR